MIPRRNLFNLSNHVDLTFDPGYLIPIEYWETLPGDTFQLSSNILIRSTPMVGPMFTALICRLHWWYVPLHIIWDASDEFHTGGEDGTSTPTKPTISMASCTQSTLHNYLGLPVGTYGGTILVDALPFRAYSSIWNQHYRDQDLATERTIDTGSGPDSTTDVTVARVAWPRDYLTTCRPWEQRGNQVTIPLGDEAPVLGLGPMTQNYQTGPVTAYESDSASASYSKYKDVDGAGNDNRLFIEEGDTGYPNIRADLASATGIDISELKLSLGLQSFMEDMARGGSRYAEYLRMIWGVKSSDARLHIPEYLGGGKNVMQVSEVVVTADSGSKSPGDLAGHGIGLMKSNTFRRFFQEHGILMGLMSVVPKAVYMDGIPRKWCRATKEDYFIRHLQHIGEQEVYNKEAYAMHGTPDGVFGYQARYDEYRSTDSRVCGEFVSTANHMHMARDFSTNPALNETFIECNPTNRVWQNTSAHKFQCHAFNRVAARRPISRRPSTRRLM